MMPAMVSSMMPAMVSPMIPAMVSIVSAIPSMVCVFVIKPHAVVQAWTDPNLLDCAAIVMAIHSHPAIIGRLVIKPISVIVSGSYPDLDSSVLFVIRTDLDLNSGSNHCIN